MTSPEENMAQLGSSLQTLLRLVHYSEEKLKGLSEEELDRVFLMTWRASGKLEKLVIRFNQFEDVLDAHRSPNAEGAESMIEKIKAQFRWRKNDHQSS